MVDTHRHAPLDPPELQRAATWTLFWPKNPPIVDPLLRTLIEDPAVQRLRRVGFLGAIDYLICASDARALRRAGTRFDHSVNVALLALRYAHTKQLTSKERRLLATAALLHDIGHGPLSHSLEPEFQRRFLLDHHQVGRDIIRGASPWGRSIADTLMIYGIDVDEVLALIDGTHHGEHAFLFDSPVNLDTIEGITRCCILLKATTPPSPAGLIDAIALTSSFPTALGDAFWTAKHAVYENLILGRTGLAADALARAYMAANAGRFLPADFYLDDWRFRAKHTVLFASLTRVRKGSLHRKPLPSLFNLDTQVEARTRLFFIDRTKEISSASDLRARYTEKKSTAKISLGSLLEALPH